MLVDCLSAPVSSFPQSDAPVVHTPPASVTSTDDPVREGKSDSERALALTIALNQGAMDNPAIGESANPALPYSAGALRAAESIAEQGIPLEWARREIYELARTFTPDRPGRGIGSIAYAAKVLPERWQRERARIDATTSQRPATAANDPAAPSEQAPAAGGGNGRLGATWRRDLKGEGLLIFGRLRDAVREEAVLLNPEMGIAGGNRLEKRIRPDALEALNAAAREALAAIGGERAIAYPRRQDEGADGLGWKFAAAYAAAHTRELPS